MRWIFWKTGEANQPLMSNEESVSGWRAVREKVFSKGYSGTRSMLIFTIAQYFLIAPVQPWMPDKSELHELVGMPKFQHYLTSSQSGIHFMVDGTLLHCGFSGIGGLNGCDHYEQRVVKGKPVQATYFYMNTRYFVSYKMLNTLKQEGQMLVSVEDTYRRRLVSFHADKQSGEILDLIFLSIVILLWFLEKNKSSNDTQSKLTKE
jgi:hypothetical protein